jgi:hypothetical protein
MMTTLGINKPPPFMDPDIFLACPRLCSSAPHPEMHRPSFCKTHFISIPPLMYTSSKCPTGFQARNYCAFLVCSIPGAYSAHFILPDLIKYVAKNTIYEPPNCITTSLLLFRPLYQLQMHSLLVSSNTTFNTHMK